MKKLLFVQLPRQNSTFISDLSLVNVLAASMIAYAENFGFINRKDWSFLPRNVLLYGSDSAIAKAIADTQAQAVFFCLQDYNLARSVFVAHQAITKHPASLFLAFGSEVQKKAADSYSPVPFHSLITSGEEEAFCKILQDLSRGKPLESTYNGNAIDSSLIPNPYLSGVLEMNKEDAVQLLLGDTGRRTAGQNAHSTNFSSATNSAIVNTSELKKVIALAQKNDIPNIHLLDKNLANLADLPTVLHTLNKAITQNIVIFSNINLTQLADAWDTPLKEVFQNSGIRCITSVLGSINPAAILAMNWNVNPEAFAKVAQDLLPMNIMLITKLYLGMPYDDYDDVIESYDFLGRESLGQNSKLVPLPFYPGQNCANISKDWILSFMVEPPHWIQATPWLGNKEMKQLVGNYEDYFDLEWSSIPAPHFAKTQGGFTSFIDARQLCDLQKYDPSTMASSVTILCDADKPESITTLAKIARHLAPANPFTLYQIVLQSNTRLVSPLLLQRLNSAFLNNEHYYEICNCLAPEPRGNFQVRFFFATRNIQLAQAAMNQSQNTEILFIEEGQSSNLELYAKGFLPFVGFDSTTLPFDTLYKLIQMYSEFRHLLIELPTELH